LVPSERFAVAMLANSWENAFGGLWEAVECITDAAIGVTMPDMSEPSDPSTWSKYAGTYDAVFEDGFEFEVVVESAGDELLITVPDPSNPTEFLTVPLENLHDSTFRIGLGEDNWWDVTFIGGPATRSKVQWLRNTRFVGFKRLDPRRSTGRVRQ
jgi:hypothetical protein